MAKIRAAFHLDEPLAVQYAYWIRDLATGELRSFKDGQPVLPKVWARFLNSLPLFIVATLLVWTISFPAGINAAIRRGSVYDRVSTFSAYALISIPGFFLAYLVILVVVDVAGVPVIGMRTFGTGDAPPWFTVLDRMWHLTLPSLLLGSPASRCCRATPAPRCWRSSRPTTCDRPRQGARGEHRDLPPRPAQRAAAVRDDVGLMLPGLVGGSVIFEQIFAWPGLGRLGYEAILARDYPIVLT